LLPRAKTRLSRRVSWRKSLGVNSGLYVKILERSEIVKLKFLVTRFKVKSLYDISYLSLWLSSILVREDGLAKLAVGIALLPVPAKYDELVDFGK
jgi:hypothetical protein